jgi:hypothetical protein
MGSGSADVGIGTGQPGPPSQAMQALRLVCRCVCVMILGSLVALAIIQFEHESARAASDPAAAADAEIPAGACVLTDVVAYTIVAGRFFSTSPACPKMIDSIGTDYALAAGRNALVGAGGNPAVVRAWLSAFGHARYVWLNCMPLTSAACDDATARRIPWTPAISAYFTSHFRVDPGLVPFLYVRDVR